MIHPDSLNAEPSWLSAAPTPEAFLSAAKKGQGRAILWLKRFDPAPYLPSIIELCTKWLGWDLQCNGPFDEYTLELADLSGNPEACAQATFQAVRGNHDRATAWHLDDLLFNWHKRGHPGARAAFGAFYDNELRQGRCVGGHAIIMIDGYQGLKRVAIAAGERLKPDGFFDPLGWINTCRDDAGVPDAEERLRADAANNASLAAFIAMLDADITHSEARSKCDASKRAWTLADIVAMADDPAQTRSDRSRAAFYWSFNAPNAEFREGARLLLESTNAELVIALRRAFRREQDSSKYRPFPLGAEALAAHVDDPSPERRAVVRMVLARQSGETPRETALRLLQRGDCRDEVIRMLQYTLRPEDMPRVMQNIEAIPVHDEVQVHDAGLDILDLGEHHKFPEIRPALRWLYEYGPCRMCRESAVEHLLDTGGLPHEIRMEAAHDASNATRHRAIHAAHPPEETDD